jgi:hypothetical protein
VDELPFAADRCPCVEKLRTCYQLLLASDRALQLVYISSGVQPVQKWRIERFGFGHGATDNVHERGGDGHTFAANVKPSARATVVSIEIGGRRETAP